MRHFFVWISLFFGAVFVLVSSCASHHIHEISRSVSCPTDSSNTALIKSYINSVTESDPTLVSIYEKIRDGIFRDALENLGLESCHVEPMFIWMNFCDGLRSSRGSTALTHGYCKNKKYHIVLLIDDEFAYSSESGLAELVAHEMVHSYCDHENLDAGKSYHEGWFDIIAGEIEKLSGTDKYSDSFYKFMGNLFRS